MLEGVASELSELVGLKGAAPELSELAVFNAELAEQAERGTATATEASTSVMDLEINTGGPFLARSRSLGAAIRRRGVMGCAHIRACANMWAAIRPATGSTPNRFMRGGDSIRRRLLVLCASGAWCSRVPKAVHSRLGAHRFFIALRRGNPDGFRSLPTWAGKRCNRVVAH